MTEDEVMLMTETETETEKKRPTFTADDARAAAGVLSVDEEVGRARAPIRQASENRERSVLITGGLFDDVICNPGGVRVRAALMDDGFMTIAASCAGKGPGLLVEW